MAERSEEKTIMSILKPLITFSLHKSSLRAVNSYIDNIAAVLSLAKVDVAPSYAVFQLLESTQITNASELVSILKSTFVSLRQCSVTARTETGRWARER